MMMLFRSSESWMTTLREIHEALPVKRRLLLEKEVRLAFKMLAEPSAYQFPIVMDPYDRINKSLRTFHSKLVGGTVMRLGRICLRIHATVCIPESSGFGNGGLSVPIRGSELFLPRPGG